MATRTKSPKPKRPKPPTAHYSAVISDRVPSDTPATPEELAAYRAEMEAEIADALVPYADKSEEWKEEAARNLRDVFQLTYLYPFEYMAVKYYWTGRGRNKVIRRV